MFATPTPQCQTVKLGILYSWSTAYQKKSGTFLSPSSSLLPNLIDLRVSLVSSYAARLYATRSLTSMLICPTHPYTHLLSVTQADDILTAHVDIFSFKSACRLLSGKAIFSSYSITYSTRLDVDRARACVYIYDRERRGEGVMVGEMDMCVRENVWEWESVCESCVCEKKVWMCACKRALKIYAHYRNVVLIEMFFRKCSEKIVYLEKLRTCACCFWCCMNVLQAAHQTYVQLPTVRDG